MDADEVHDRLTRALGHASAAVGVDKDVTAGEILRELAGPLALVSIALELRELRLRGAPMTLEPVAVHEATEPADERSAKVQRDALDDDAF